MPTRMAIDKLKNDLVVMGEMCESALDTAIMALLDREQDLACYVIDYDREIDEMELNIDRQCVDLMREGKLDGEVLRFVSAAAKINNDLERVGDLAVEISRHVMFLVNEKSILPQVVDFMEMANQVAQMMRESIQALLEHDTTLAWKIIDERQIIEDEVQIVFRHLLAIMKRNDRAIERCCHILFICQNLQRVSDQATNIAEEVIYMAEGVNVRHHLKEMHPFVQMPLEDSDHAELEDFETELVSQTLPKEELRKEQQAAKEQSKVISEDQVREAAQSGRFKAKEARKKLLKMRASMQGK